MADGRVLGDRYEIQAPLGTGGMATVYRGRDRLLDRAVAIKMLAPKYAGDEKFVTRFQREARAAAGLNHPTIVSVYDTGDTDGEHYIVMELVEGETLADLLRRSGPLSADQTARIASGIAEALQAAHDQGLIHRDVKPGNVMLTSAGAVKVMDFGIARAATDDTLTQTGLIMGTASYLSPEQSRGDPVDHRSDVYSLGCVAYEMLTGSPPFSGDAPLSVAYKHVHDQPARPSSIRPSIPAETETVVLRALAKDPDARFPSAEAFRQAITAAAGGEPTEPLGGDTALLPATTEPIPPTVRRGRSWVPVAVLAAVLLGGGVMALTLAGDDERPGDERRGGRRSERTPPPEEPSAEPETPATVLGVEQAILALRELVAASLEDGLVTEEVAEEVLEEEAKATEEFAKGDLNKALEHLDHADADIETALAAGAVTTPDAATSFHAAIAALRQAMLAVAPPTIDEGEEEGEEEGEGEEGEGSGPGKSEEAPGQQKKEEKDDD